MQVRAFERVKLVGGGVQGRPEFVWCRECVEVRRVNEEGVVTASERSRYMVGLFVRTQYSRGRETKGKVNFACFGLLSSGSRCI